MKRSTGLGLILGVLALTGCNGDRSPSLDPELQPLSDGANAAPTAPEASPTASIIRPEVVPDAASSAPLGPLEATIPFAEGGVALGAEAEQALIEVLRSPQLAGNGPIVLRGHTDSAGGDRANLRASQARAEAVAEWLVERGVGRERITVIALGEQRPIAPNAHLDGTPDDEGRAKNRRVTVTIGAPGNGDGIEAGVVTPPAVPDG